MKMRFLLLTVVLSLCVAVWPAQGAPSVTDDVKKVVDQVIRIVSSKDLKKPQNERKRRAELRKTIGSIFDYRQMSKLALGAHWRKRSPAEQKAFVPLFETLLENSYANKIESYNNEKVVYTRESVENDYAEVRSKVITTKGQEYSLDYRLTKEGNRWMVYDVVIEGVSLVANYRSQFNRVIQTQGYGELVKKLQTKSAEIKPL
ncbi:MAG TPA: ABC transporter substrate-binding protein [Geobacteraceae bacterium]